MARAANSNDEAIRSVLLLESSVAKDALLLDETVRREKVARLSAAIADGTYSVSAEALAEKMIERMTEADSLPTEKPNS